VFAYGQTGSGKTFTMMGNGQSAGLYTLTVEEIFNRKAKNQRIYVSFYEIYCSNLYDLLHERAKLILREDANSNVNVVGIMQIEVSCADELLQCIEKGNDQRITSTTSANYDSSRSHSILQIRIIEDQFEVGKLCFIDLAGNERGADTYDNDKQTRLDGAEINKSLLALKECIRALDQGGKHTPFRGSKLTQVLKDSFIGNCRTMMIANIAPSNCCCELTLNTLRYADRVKELSTVKPMGSVNKKEGLSDNLMLPRKDKKVKPASIEFPEKINKDNGPMIEKPPKPIENKPLYSYQDIEKNPSSNHQFSKNPSVKNQRSDPKILKNDKHHRSDSVSKNEAKFSSSKEIKRLNENSSNIDRFADDGYKPKYDNKAVGNKKLKPIPIKPVNQGINKSNTMLPTKKRPEKFQIIEKFFQKPIESYSRDELKEIHLNVIDDMIVYEESFLKDHEKYVSKYEECLKRQRKVYEKAEEPDHEVDPYLEDTEKLLDYEFESTNALKSKLLYFKKYLGEENAFAKKYVCEPQYDKGKDYDYDDKEAFEIRSHDSLLIED